MALPSTKLAIAHKRVILPKLNAFEKAIHNEITAQTKNSTIA